MTRINAFGPQYEPDMADLIAMALSGPNDPSVRAWANAMYGTPGSPLDRAMAAAPPPPPPGLPPQYQAAQAAMMQANPAMSRATPGGPLANSAPIEPGNPRSAGGIAASQAVPAHPMPYQGEGGLLPQITAEAIAARQAEEAKLAAAVNAMNMMQKPEWEKGMLAATQPPDSTDLNSLGWDEWKERMRLLGNAAEAGGEMPSAQMFPGMWRGASPMEHLGTKTDDIVDAADKRAQHRKDLRDTRKQRLASGNPERRIRSGTATMEDLLASNQPEAAQVAMMSDPTYQRAQLFGQMMAGFAGQPQGPTPEQMEAAQRITMAMIPGPEAAPPVPGASATSLPFMDDVRARITAHDKGGPNELLRLLDDIVGVDIESSPENRAYVINELRKKGYTQAEITEALNSPGGLTYKPSRAREWFGLAPKPTSTPAVLKPSGMGMPNVGI